MNKRKNGGEKKRERRGKGWGKVKHVFSLWLKF